MNCSAYIFGELSEGYSQYPDDGSSALFKGIYSHCIPPSQLVIHRDDGMMYYAYVRKFTQRGYIGFALCLNGYYFTQIHELFDYFEHLIEQLIEKGVILNLSTSGDLTSPLSSFLSEEDEVSALLSSLQSECERLHNKPLPQADYSVSIDSQKIFNENDDQAEIIRASYTYGFTIVLKQENYDTLRTRSLSNTLKELNARNESLTEKCEALEAQNKEIQRQKKQFRNVVILIIGLLLCVGGLVFVSGNLSDTKNKLEDAHKAMDEYCGEIATLEQSVNNQETEISELKSELSVANSKKAELSSTLQKIGSRYPFVVTSMNVNSTTIEFDYYCPRTKEVTLTLKAVNVSNSEIVTSTHTLNLNEGTGSRTLSFSKKLNNSAYYNSTQFYYVLLIYNGQVIAGKYW